MAIVDVVKCEMTDVEFCRKFPSTDLRLGSQLVVYPSQLAFFLKGGVICDCFEAGTYTLETKNIPVLNGLIKLPFGGDTPFQAEVWFVNLTTKLNMKWGTTSPIMLEDPKYGIIVPVRAYGQYGIRVSDAKTFLSYFVGNMPSFTAFKIHEYFKGQLLMNLSNAVSEKIAKDNISILEISNHLLDMSEHCEKKINSIFEKYGIAFTDFAIMSVNIPYDDPSVIKLKEAKDFAARLKIAGKEGYQMERSFNALEKAASNEGFGGDMTSMGAGLGVGFGIGGAFKNLANQFLDTNPSPVAQVNTMPQSTPPPIQETTYFVYVNGQQIGGQRFADIANLVNQRIVTKDTLCWKTGLSNWVKAADLPELLPLFIGNTPPPVPPIPNNI